MSVKVYRNMEHSIKSLYVSFTSSLSVSSVINILYPHGTFLPTDELVWIHFISTKGLSLC